MIKNKLRRLIISSTSNSTTASSELMSMLKLVPVPPHRYTPLKKAWLEIYTPIYEEMKIDIRMNLKARRVELKTRRDTPDVSNLQKCADFVHAFMLGFDVIDAVALLRMDELYVESFEIKDVKTLRGEHLSRAIGRLSGKGGKTKFAIENATRTRIVIADTKIHMLGSFANIKVARDSLCSLILGSPAAKVYSKLRACLNTLGALVLLLFLISCAVKVMSFCHEQQTASFHQFYHIPSIEKFDVKTIGITIPATSDLDRYFLVCPLDSPH
ncbi:RNA-binding KH domain-containing protein [Striga hermonthica]|uniref:RNA-binding KH domain-containing protein n=1 Tax=Striga hermonthica TaxID=68872 RepID=A0A9N7MB89_STRHE|nr:RNA-binding KH domain-containing protein [Striga hermonthica]